MELKKIKGPEDAMRRAIALAKRASGDTHPNPIVGAVIVENGKIVAEGWHERAGMPHAERRALANLRRPPKPGATLYVTLEPCSTHGRTGACTDAIVAAKISNVVVGATDPNPAHCGRGLEILRQSGVNVVAGVLARECENLNPIFNHAIRKNTPLLAAKCALLPDGKMFRVCGERLQITGEKSRNNVMQERRYFPAIAVGSGTVLCDNPALTARIAGKPVFCPVRFVFDRSGRTLEITTNPKVFSDEFASRTILATTEKTALVAEKILQRSGVRVLPLPDNNEKFWEKFRAFCMENSLTGVYFEGGKILLKSLFAAHQADWLYAYVAGTPEKSPEKFFCDEAEIVVAGTKRFDNDVEIFGAISYR